MEAKTDRLYTSAPLEIKNDDLERRMEKRLSDVNSFNNSINNIKEMITYFKDKINKSKKRYKIYKTLNTVLESIDSIIIIGATSNSINLSITGIGLIVLPISAGIACTLSLGNKVLHELIINKYNKYKKQYERDQQTIKSFDKLCRKSLQDNIIDKTEIEHDNKNNHNNRTLLVGPSFSGKTYLMLKTLSRMPDRDFYIITKSPPEQYTNSKIKTRKWHWESADPAKALGPSDILDLNPVVDISDR